ncbi:MAG: carbon monoxide dehydrogenase subunit G [Rhodospirillaceae bacterium]|nr:carbon monoxide dehydrogenase subunit G [Rhodospirillaceae bacterium]
MDMTGEYRIAAPREKVWEALNDPAILQQCIPGCEEIQKNSETQLSAKVTAKVGPVKAKFAGDVTLSDLNPPESYTITGEGKGGAAGFAKGGAKVNLAEDGDATVLTYEVHVSVGGKLAQLGARLVSGTAKKMADDFFGRFSDIVHAQAVAPAAEPAAAPAVEAETVAPTEPPVAMAAVAPPPPPPTPAPVAAPPPARVGLSPVIWIGGVVVLVLVLILIFTT